MKKMLIGLLVAVGIVVVLVGMYVSIRNSIVQKHEAVKEAWSEVDVQITRRADLIPNLVATVKGYAQHEQTVFDNVARANAALLNAHTPQDRMAANNQMDGALGHLLALVENYPQLKANENFLELQDQLEGTENRIAVARRRYNLALRSYNAYIAMVPNNLVAGWSGFSRDNAYFESTPAERAVPKVNFDTPAPSSRTPAPATKPN